MSKDNALGFSSRWVREKSGVIYSAERRKLQLRFNALFNEIALPNGATLTIDTATTDLLQTGRKNHVLDAFIKLQMEYKSKKIDDEEAKRRLTGIKTCMAAQLHLIS